MAALKNPMEALSKIYRENAYSSDIQFAVQDSCGPAYKWPAYIKAIIKSTTFCYAERIKLTTFFWVNGFRNREGWLQFLVRIKGPAFHRYGAELNTLFKYYGEESTQKKYFSFCVTHQRYEFLDGLDRDTK